MTDSIQFDNESDESDDLSDSLKLVSGHTFSENVSNLVHIFCKLHQIQQRGVTCTLNECSVPGNSMLLVQRQVEIL